MFGLGEVSNDLSSRLEWTAISRNCEATADVIEILTASDLFTVLHKSANRAGTANWDAGKIISREAHGPAAPRQVALLAFGIARPRQTRK